MSKHFEPHGIKKQLIEFLLSRGAFVDYLWKSDQRTTLRFRFPNNVLNGQKGYFIRYDRLSAIYVAHILMEEDMWVNEIELALRGLFKEEDIRLPASKDTP